ncbi:minor capsid protein [Paenibacillus sp. FSL K6-0108]|uniref:minor capsid protein n=1 Tax=Paenibacillus sp. FSL K6-0108 TaxID=2921417 RepID=UPI00324BE9D7
MATLGITDITAYLRVAVPYTYVANEFAAGNPDDCAYVRMSGGYEPSEWTSKRRPAFQVLVRAKSSAKATQIADAIYEDLASKGEFYFGTVRIVKCRANQSSPIYLGKDANDRTMYSLNFTLTTI